MKEVLAISWPLIIANSFWNLQMTIDRIYLGNYSPDALASAIAVMGVFWTPMALVQQTAAYSTTFVAQYFGAKKYEMVGPSLWHAIYLSIIGGLLFLLLIPFSPTVFKLIGHSDRLQGLEAEYLAALCYSALPTALVAAISGFFTGLGRSQVIMWINGVGVLANMFFDYVLIFGNWGFPELGIAGAGYATSLANGVATVFAFVLVLRSDKELKYKVFSGWRVQWDLMKRYVKFGIPSGMQWALEGLAFTVFLIFVGQMKNGEAALASSGIALTVLMLAILPALGVAQGVSVLVGQHLGEGKSELAEQSSWSGLICALIYISIAAISFVLFPEFYIGWFKSEGNPEIWAQVNQAVPVLLIMIAGFVLFDSMNLVFSFALKGAGDTRFVTLVALCVPWPFMVIPTWLMKDWDHSLYWAWAACSLFACVQASIFFARFVGGKWKRMSVM